MAPAFQTELGQQLAKQFRDCPRHQNFTNIQSIAADYATRLTIEAHTDASFKSHQIGAHFGDAKFFQDLANALQPFTGAD